MTQHKGSKGRNLVAKPRKRPRKSDIARAIHEAKVRPFANLRLWRERQQASKENAGED
jgi:hypothetical protein